MSNIIEFPQDIKDPIDQMVEHFKLIYEKDGLTPPQISNAIEELEPIIREILPPMEFTFDLSEIPNLSEMQLASIFQEHKKCMEVVVTYYWDQLWTSLCATAKFIGRHAQNQT